MKFYTIMNEAKTHFMYTDLGRTVYGEMPKKSGSRDNEQDIKVLRQKLQSKWSEEHNQPGNHHKAILDAIGEKLVIVEITGVTI